MLTTAPCQPSSFLLPSNPGSNDCVALWYTTWPAGAECTAPFSAAETWWGHLLSCFCHRALNFISKRPACCPWERGVNYLLSIKCLEKRSYSQCLADLTTYFSQCSVFLHLWLRPFLRRLRQKLKGHSTALPNPA